MLKVYQSSKLESLVNSLVGNHGIDQWRMMFRMLEVGRIACTVKTLMFLHTEPARHMLNENLDETHMETAW